MSDDQRVARDDAEPAKSGPGGGERWAAYLDWCRQEIIDGVLSLPADQRRRTLVPSAWTPIELLSHVLHMEQRWFIWGFLAEPVDEPWGDWNVDNPQGDSPDARWHVPDDVTAEELARQLAAIGDRTRTILAEYPLTTVGATGGQFTAGPPTLEWICFHVLAEYARHAGHLDIVVEQSGG